MPAGNIIVKINAGFAQGKELFAWLQKYAQHTDDSFAYWDEFAFTAENIPETDALLVFNHPSEKIEIVCDPRKIIAFMMEPGMRWQHPWMFNGLDQYARVYSPLNNSSNTIVSHGYLGWYLQQNYPFLSALAFPEKSLVISCIASNLKQLKGHRLRTDFIHRLGKQMPQIDFFGKGTRFLPDKLDGLLPYRYSIAIENTSATDYFTEKINDCFLAHTVPFYYGCRNIDRYFPDRSFIRINIEEPEQAIRKIRETLEADDWKDRLTAVEEARQLVLNKYQPLAGAADILREMAGDGKKKTISLKPMPVNMRTVIKKMLLKLAGKE